MKSNPGPLEAAGRVVLLSFICSSTAHAGDFNWNVIGAPADWNNPNSWIPFGVPNGPDDVAIFEGVGAFGSPDTINQDGGPFTAKLRYDNAFVTHTSTGDTPHILDDGQDRPHISVIDSDVVFDQGLNLQTDTLIILGSNQPLGGFSRLTFMEPIETNDNDITIAAQPNITALVTTTEDFIDPNNTSQLSLSNAILEVNATLTVEAAEVSGGEVFVPNASSQLRVPTLTLQRGGAFTIGDSTDPLPVLTQNVQASGGALNHSGTQVANVSQGAMLVSGHNTFDAGFGANAGFNFNGRLTSNLGTANFRASNPATQLFTFTDDPDRIVEDIIPYATFNNDDFARYDAILNRIEPLTTYVNDINAAGPTDPVQVNDTQMLTANRQAAVVKLGASGAVDLNGNTLTTNSLLATDFANEISNGVIVPFLGSKGVMYILVPLGNDNLTLNNVDIADNGATPTDLVISGNGSVTINNTLSKTGDTDINAGAALRLNGPSADPGGFTVNLGDGGGFPASVVLQDTTLTQNIIATPSTFAPFPGDGIVANGASTISGNISVRNDGEAPRTLGINVPNADDMLTIAGNIGPADPDADAFNIKIQGAGTVELAEGTTHTVPGTVTVEGSTLRIRKNAQIIHDDFPDAGEGIGLERLVIVSLLGRMTGTGGIRAESIQDPASATTIAVSFLFGVIEPGSSIGTLAFGGDVEFLGTEGPAIYRAEVTDTGQADKLDIDGLLDLSGANDFLELDFFSGSTLNGIYTLATYSEVAGVFNTVTFEGNLIADPTVPGAFMGTHHLDYGAAALRLVPEPASLTLLGALILLTASRCLRPCGQRY